MAAHRPVNPPPMMHRSALMGAESEGRAAGASGWSDQNVPCFAAATSSRIIRGA